VGSDTAEVELKAAISDATLIFHLAGVNRPQAEEEFESGNAGFTRTLCKMLADAGNPAAIIFASSTQTERDNAYGRSKLAAEEAIFAHAEATGAGVRVLRLPNVFGKWARPNYNSAVATFCHNIARGQPITVNDPDAQLNLIHVDDVCDAFLAFLDEPPTGAAFAEAGPVYATTVGVVADAIRGFAASRETLTTDRVGTGLTRALYSTYVSYLPPSEFVYDVPRHADPRGVFVEMLKTPDTGQFPYFTAGPGVTRGQHYHHAKTEKFLVLKGLARFGFRHIVTGERHEIMTEGGEARIVETIPGWTHDITNVGEDEMIVMLWANEIFDRARPDTIAEAV
jgi:UDP-2-acetamido-2,6-beta-L-arabino-hexul-4-ose reductase